VAVAEKQHERRYATLKSNIEKGIVFTRKEETTWRCLNCGYVHKGTGAPDKCPACVHPKAFFELLGENW